MLDLPGEGVPSNHARIDVLCDWVEGHIAFVGRRLSRTSLLDVLTENNVYSSQDRANEILGEVWLELRRRARFTKGHFPLEVQDRHLERIQDWRKSPGYAFCLYLSLLRWYPDWAKKVVDGAGYEVQGSLFERLALEALRGRGWKAELTGWSTRKADKLKDVVPAVCRFLHEQEIPGGVAKFARPQSNECGLDIVCCHDFEDGRAAKPFYLVQSASGANWETKLGTPSTELWSKLVVFTHNPTRAFVIPFSLNDHEFNIAAGKVSGMVLDRTRVMGRTIGSDWLSPSLRRELELWVRPRVAKLPTT